MNSGYQPYEMCPLIKVKIETVACRAYMLAQQTVGHVVTSQIHAVPAIFHGHKVSFANVCTKSHRSRFAIELLRLVVDLPTVLNEICPSIGRQHDVLARIGRGGYAHHTRLNDEHPILLVAKNEQRTLWWWRNVFADGSK